VTTRRHAAVALAAWIAGLGLAIAGLHALGSGPLATPRTDGLTDWLRTTDPAVVAATTVRLGCLALAWYLLAVTVVTGAARVVRLPAPATRTLDALAPAPLRRLVRRAAGVALATGTLATALPVTPAWASTETDRDPIVMRRLPDEGSTAPTPQSPQAPPPTAPATWRIEPGQHLWLVAERTLERAWGHPPDDRAVDPYWRALIERNRHRLVDPANPDLVLAGQELELPDVPPSPTFRTG
jgi:hypothetical protein